MKTSHIDIATDHIDIMTGGNLSLAGGNFNLTGGTGTKAIGMSTNRADEYMMWAGNATPSSAPFSVKRDGSVKATKIQQEYSQSFWDMADYGTNGNGVNPFPAEFDFYIPSGYSIDFVKLSFKVGKARTFAKGGASGGGGTSGSNSAVSGSGTSRTTSGGSSTAQSHTHTYTDGWELIDHTHSTPNHTHGLVFGITEKSTLATASTLKIDGTTIAGDWYFMPDSGGDEIVLSSAVSGSGWHKITIQPNNDARISCYLRIGLTPS